MGTSLNGLTPAGTYPGLIKTGDNAPIDGTLKTLSDGNGNNLPMAVSTTAVNFTNQLQQSGVAVPTASQVAAKQDTLVSGTNIKTINGTSVLGSGNIVTPTTSPSGVSGAIQFSNGSAFASDAANLFWDDTNNRLGVGTNAPTATGHFRGAGTTGITTSLLVQDSAGTNLMSLSDNGVLNLFSSTKTGQLVVDGGGISGIYTKAYNSLSDNIIRYKDWNANQCMMLTMTGLGTGSLTVNNGITSLGATVGIKGSGSTSATTSLLVQNSAGAASLQVTDDGSVTNRGKSGIASNVAFGIVALNDNVTGYSNTAIGTNALQNNTSHSNTAVGQLALQTNTTGALNSALGVGTSSGNFSGSTILGYGATATANNQFVVGSTGTNAGAVNSTSDVPATFLWSVRINGTNYKILMTT